MSSGRKKLTDASVRNIKPRSERFDVWELNGLTLRVFPSGVKSWAFVYYHEGRRRRMTLGNYPGMSVAQAHEAHGKALASRAQGIDPGELIVRKRQETRDSSTVAGLVDEYIKRHAKPNKLTWRDDERILKKEVVSRWGTRKASDIRRRDVIALLDEIALRAPVMANRVLAVLRKCYNWGISRDLVETSPCVQVERPTPERERDRYLTRDEIRAFLAALRTPDVVMSQTTRTALRLLLATGQRPGEIAGAAWSEVDLEEKLWTIPAERSKNGLAHRVPLNKPALAALKVAESLGETDWVFPAPNAKGPMRPLSLATAIRRNLEVFKIAPFTPHDLRRTCATNLAALGVTRFVIARILNHVERGVTKVYDRFGYDAEKRAALDAWGERLEELSKAAKKTKGGKDNVARIRA